MITLRLYGELGKKFGKVHVYATKSIAQTIRLLIANYPEIKEVFNNQYSQYKVSVDTNTVAIKEFNDPLNNTTIRIVPVLEGAGSDEAMIVGGILLLAFAWWAAPVVGAGGAAVGGSAALSGIALNAGLALTYAGISSLLYVPPKEQVANQSTGFDGPLNTTRQGACVPIGYGECIVGSAVISAGITNRSK